jgi:hypothetical protein
MVRESGVTSSRARLAVVWPPANRRNLQRRSLPRIDPASRRGADTAIGLHTARHGRLLLAPRCLRQTVHSRLDSSHTSPEAAALRFPVRTDGASICRGEPPFSNPARWPRAVRLTMVAHSAGEDPGLYARFRWEYARHDSHKPHRDVALRALRFAHEESSIPLHRHSSNKSHTDSVRPNSDIGINCRATIKVRQQRQSG